MKKLKCPDCNGKGYQEYISDNLFSAIIIDDSPKVTRVQCDSCKGLKVIDDPSEDTKKSNLPEFKW